jgi:hypothetical protein
MIFIRDDKQLIQSCFSTSVKPHTPNLMPSAYAAYDQSIASKISLSLFGFVTTVGRI